MNWRQWLIGLANALVSGVASGVPASLVGANWKQVVAIAGSSAAVSLTKWILQHPLPGTPTA